MCLPPYEKKIQLYHGKDKLHFNAMMMMSALD